MIPQEPCAYRVVSLVLLRGLPFLVKLILTWLGTIRHITFREFATFAPSFKVGLVRGVLRERSCSGPTLPPHKFEFRDGISSARCSLGLMVFTHQPINCNELETLLMPQIKACGCPYATALVPNTFV